MNRLAIAAILAFCLFGESVARADLVSESEVACRSKKDGDACAMPNGEPGACVAILDGRQRARIDCVKPGQTSPLSTPVPWASNQPSSLPSASPVTTTVPQSSANPSSPSGACSVQLGSEGASTSILAVAFFTAGLAGAARRRGASRRAPKPVLGSCGADR